MDLIFKQTCSSRESWQYIEDDDATEDDDAIEDWNEKGEEHWREKEPYWLEEKRLY